MRWEAEQCTPPPPPPTHTHTHTHTHIYISMQTRNHGGTHIHMHACTYLPVKRPDARKGRLLIPRATRAERQVSLYTGQVRSGQVTSGQKTVTMKLSDYVYTFPTTRVNVTR